MGSPSLHSRTKYKFPPRRTAEHDDAFAIEREHKEEARKVRSLAYDALIERYKKIKNGAARIQELQAARENNY
jgi:hypothetical protein